MIHGAPGGSIGAANPSGWSTETTFVMFMNHCMKFVRPTKEQPVIILLDNHESPFQQFALQKKTEYYGNRTYTRMQ